MGFLIKKRRLGWRLLHRIDHGTKVEERIIPKSELSQYGLSSDMSFEEAKASLSSLRSDEKAKRESERQARLLARKVPKSDYLPPDWVAEFESTVLPSTNIRRHIWNKAKETIAKTNFSPEDWHWMPDPFYKLFQQHKWSPDYCRRILASINKWGAFYSRKRRCPFMPIDGLGAGASKIRAAHYLKNPEPGTRPLALSDLNRAATLLPPKEHLGLRVMFWCGLRPEELRLLLREGGNWRIQTDDPRFAAVLHVFQPKLQRRGTPPAQCWKSIPLVEPEQKSLRACLIKKTFARPNFKKLKAAGISATERSARKGFVAVFQQRGYSKTCIQRWLGHVGRDTYELHYETKAIAYYEAPVKKA